MDQRGCVVKVRIVLESDLTFEIESGFCLVFCFYDGHSLIFSNRSAQATAFGLIP